MLAVDDAGLDRLRARMGELAARDGRRRRPTTTLTAATDARQPTVPIEHAGEVVAPAAGLPLLAVGRGVYWRVRTEAEARGASTVDADRIARRCARIVTLEHAGYGHGEAAHRAGVDERQARRDRTLLASIDHRDLAGDFADGELLPPVPGEPSR